MAFLWYLARVRNAFLDTALVLIAGRPAAAVRLERVGGGYGGFWIPRSLMGERDGLLVSGGIGFDVNFERALADRGYQVIAVDPLENCVTFARENLRGSNVHIVAAGLWSRDERVAFYAPRDPSHDSWSAVNIQETSSEEALEFNVVSIASIFQNYPTFVRRRPAVLKLNIEGAEAEVLSHLSDSPVEFDVIAVHLESVSQVRLRSPGRFVRECVRAAALMRQLRSEGYRAARSRNLQMCLVHKAYTSRGLRGPKAA